jgi:butyryl-CoA dehydrogenase
MDFALTDEQELIRATAREFTEREIAPTARDRSRDHAFDLDLVAKVARQGYLGAIVPPEYGGAGLDYRSYGLVVEEIGRGDSSVRTVVSVQTSLVCSILLKFGTEAQKRTYLPPLCTGEILGCFGLTEPDTGSDAANQKTRATRTEGGWRLNGAKMWISMGCHAKLALVFAQTDPDAGHRGTACFLVDTQQPGFQATPIDHKMGLHAADTAEIALDDVFVPDDHVLGEIGQGFKIAMTALDSGRFSVASGCVGVCASCLDESVKYSTQRTQFDRPIASFQLVQAMIAEMRVRTDAARLLVWRAGWMKDNNLPNTTETSIAKLYASEAAVWVANEAIQLHGGAGYSDDHPVERHFRDVRVTTLYEGTSQIQKLIIGRAETGINALVPA